MPRASRFPASKWSTSRCEPPARLTLNAANTTFASVTADDGAERANVALNAAADPMGRALPAIDAWIKARKWK